MQNLVHTCDVWRMAAVGSNGSQERVQHATGISCLFLPMSARAAVENGFDVGQGWQVFMDDGADVKVNDRLVFNGIGYLVRGVQRFTGLPMVSHVEISAVTENAQ